MAVITLEYDYSDIQAKKALDYILSLGIFKPASTRKEDPISVKRKILDHELENYLVNLSSYKFNREDANS